MFNRYSMLTSYISKYLGRNIFRDNEEKTFDFSSKFFNPIWNCFIGVDPTQANEVKIDVWNKGHYI